MKGAFFALLFLGFIYLFMISPRMFGKPDRSQFRGVHYAHRGLFDNKKIFENTIKAFDNAFKNNYDGIELDVRLTKDNIPIVIHDSFLSRVFKVRGRVKDYTYKELKNKEKRIPKLDEVIKRLKGITCGFKRTSCPDQIATALEKIKNGEL